MKKLSILISVLMFFTGLSFAEDSKINGIMIDCSRLLEKHDYYYRLLDFMAEWDMNTLLLHFSDDHGLSIELPGFEKLAHRHAFTPFEIQTLIEYAHERGIDIIPELEVFGHTRYITDHPDYRHLFLGNSDARVTFNAIDPTKPETINLIHDMVGKVAAMFPSPYFHLGCDEVNLSALGLKNDSKEATLWANYVNDLIAYTAGLGKQPMIWDDHLKKSALIADMIDRNVILVDWNYDPDYRPDAVLRLKEMGFQAIVMAPSISCWRNRMIPSKPQLKNVNIHAEQVQNGTAVGMINTVWLPMRYVQNAMWYGMAYGAYVINHSGKTDLKKFNRIFAKKVFGLSFNSKTQRYLDLWTSLHLDRRFFSAIVNNDFDILNDMDKIKELDMVHRLSGQLIALSDMISVKKNREIFDSMCLTTEIIDVICESFLIIAEKDNIPISRKQACLTMLHDVIDRTSTEWDRDRYPDDPAKIKAKFSNQESSHLLIVLHDLENYLSQ